MGSAPENKYLAPVIERDTALIPNKSVNKILFNALIISLITERISFSIPITSSTLLFVKKSRASLNDSLTKSYLLLPDP